MQELPLTNNRGFSKLKFKRFTNQLDIQTMVWPGIIFLFIFSYMPMYGILIAFKDYSIASTVAESDWVGFKYFQQFLVNENFIRALRNTVALNMIGLAIGFPAPLIFALLLNEVRNQKFKRITQTISYLPHFLSWVIYGGLMLSLFSLDAGVVNDVLVRTGLIERSIFWWGEPRYFWVLAILTNMAKSIGWGAILYLAAIAGVDGQLYEAAVIDGASRLQRTRHVTIPGITGTIVILMIFTIANSFNYGFDQIWILQNNINVSMSEIIDTYVYKTGLAQLRFSYAAAVGVSRSVVAMILLVIANYTSKKITDQGLF